jgi:hypothetical protein
MARVRNTKLRAQRIELDYFKRRHWLRQGRFWLGLVALAGTGAWIASMAARRDQAAVSPGPVSTGHALIAARCETCHAPDSTTPNRWLASTDTACRSCHRAAAHQTANAREPACATCHREHRGGPVLAQVATAQCTACHGNLRAQMDGRASLVVGADAQAIHGLADGHPEFAIWVDRGPTPKRVRLDAVPPPLDPSHLKFSHAKHLSPDLRGPAGMPTVQLVCGDCHEGPLQATTLRFGKKPAPITPLTAPDFAPAEEPQYFAPIRYETHCAACHPHTFDARIDAAPHDTPYVVRRFLQGAYARYAIEHPDVLTGTPRRRPITGGATATSAPSPEEWARDQVAAAEDLFYRQPCPENETCPRCQQCHTIEQRGDAEVPTVVPPALPVRWLPQSRFDHGAHRLLRCVECHGGAPTSAKASDVLVPRIASCRSCHHPDGAADRCSECHTYHGATGPVEMNGAQTIRALSGSSAGGGT